MVYSKMFNDWLRNLLKVQGDDAISSAFSDLSRNTHHLQSEISDLKSQLTTQQEDLQEAEKTVEATKAQIRAKEKAVKTLYEDFASFCQSKLP